MKKHHILLLLAFAIMSIVSCKDENNIGPDEPMKWEHSIPNFENNKIKVDANGGVFVLKNINYPGFYITEILDCDSVVYFYNFEPEQPTLEYKGNWFAVNKNNDTLKIEIQPKNNDVNRSLTINIQFLDAFNTLYIEQ
ncbi:hypothetical protein [uncultured Bacteroides sp.]|uniref:hypothetical protein n=1 Tax=uncultured Bacteroides sp. TaxID=162156 RepID=UPI00280B3FC0|nr:hypothetical protein [uncultured Bacteroides sp.]